MMQRSTLTGGKKIGRKLGRRRAIALHPETLVQTRPLVADRAIPLVIEPIVEGLDLGQWSQMNRDYIDTLFHQHRALLFRNFQVHDAATFEHFVQTTSDGPLLSYIDRTSPRTAVAGQVYTSTVYAADRMIPLHNESSYSVQWPLKIFFCCLQVAKSGGETPIADVRRVCDRLPTTIRTSFQEKQWMLKRRYNYGFGLPWQEVFQTEDRAVVDAYCQQHGIEDEWLDQHHLETRQIRPAIHAHPDTGESVWFNHVAFFHDTSLASGLRQDIASQMGDKIFPYSTYYGDGTAIAPDIITRIRHAYEQEMVIFPWQSGDILMLDNMAIAHGRQPYTGQRQVVVAMTEAYGKAEGKR